MLPIWLSNSADQDELMQNIASQLGLPCFLGSWTYHKKFNLEIVTTTLKLFQTEWEGVTIGNKDDVNQSATTFQLHKGCYRIFYMHIPIVEFYELIQLLFLQALYRI